MPKRIAAPQKISRLSFATYVRTMKQVLAEDPLLLLPHDGVKELATLCAPTDHSSIIMPMTPSYEVRRFLLTGGYREDSKHRTEYGKGAGCWYAGDGSSDHNRLTFETYRGPELVLRHESRDSGKKLFIVRRKEFRETVFGFRQEDRMHDETSVYGSVLAQSGLTLHGANLSDKEAPELERRFRSYQEFYAALKITRLREPYASAKVFKGSFTALSISTPIEYLDSVLHETGDHPFEHFRVTRAHWDAVIRLMEKMIEAGIPALYIPSYQSSYPPRCEITALNKVELSGVLVK
jgi:hypothetical protein